MRCRPMPWSRNWIVRSDHSAERFRLLRLTPTEHAHDVEVLLDPRGKQFSSEKLSEYLDGQALGGTGELAFAIGGPDGHTDELRSRAHLLWSLGELTLPHDLAMLVLVEALYRAATISAGEPYHRG